PNRGRAGRDLRSAPSSNGECEERGSRLRDGGSLGVTVPLRLEERPRPVNSAAPAKSCEACRSGAVFNNLVTGGRSNGPRRRGVRSSEKSCRGTHEAVRSAEARRAYG